MFNCALFMSLFVIIMDRNKEIILNNNNNNGNDNDNIIDL